MLTMMYVGYYGNKQALLHDLLIVSAHVEVYIYIS